MSNFTYSDELYHAGKSKSKYAGGFTMIKGRMNNTSAYNHDYYRKNLEKWKKKAKKALGFDAKEEMDKAAKRTAHFESHYTRVYDWNSYRGKDGTINLSDYDKSRAIYEEARKNAQEAFDQAVSRYYKTPLGKVDNFLSDASWEVEYAYDTVKDFAKKTMDEIDYQIWSIGDDIERAVKKRKKRKK